MGGFSISSSKANAAAAPCSTSGGGAGICYVDTASSGGDGTTQATSGAHAAFATVANINGYTYTAGDRILSRRGCSWSGTKLTLSSSGSNGNPIIFGSYGSGPLPVFSIGSGNLVDTNGKNYITFQDIEFDGRPFYINASSGINVQYCVFKNSASNVINAVNSVASILNNVIINGANTGVLGSGDSLNLTVKNNIILANGLAGSYGISTSGAGTFFYDYNFILGNNTYPAININSTGLTDGGHNIVTGPVGLTSLPNNNVYFVMSTDDDSQPYQSQLASTIASYGGKITHFVVPTELSAGDIAYVQGEAAAGHEIAVHDYSHSSLILTTATTISTTNSNPVINLNRTTKTLSLTSDTPGNNVVVDWSSSVKTLNDLSTAISGKGWTNTPATNVSGYLELSGLADTGGNQTAFPYNLTVDVTAGNGYPYWTNEIQKTIDWITTNIGIMPTVMAYPLGLNNSALITYTESVSGLLGARTTGVLYTLVSTPIYQIGSVAASNANFKQSGSEGDIRKAADNLYYLGKSLGLPIIILTHSSSELSIQQAGWLADELSKLGVTFQTFGSVVAAIRADHSTSDGLTYTKTYPDVSDFHLLPSSSAIDAGTPIAGLTTDYAGNKIYGLPDIGGYEYQPPHTMGTDKIDIGAGARVYGDGKFRDVGTTNSTLADLKITTSGGTFSETTSPIPAWLDISNITNWTNTHKTWKEGNAEAGLTTTDHTIGDLNANKWYEITVSDVDVTLHIIGIDSVTGLEDPNECKTVSTTRSCKSDNDGKIYFRYDGGYSGHTFDMNEGDNAGPTLSFDEDVEPGPVKSDTITANWGGAAVTKWDYDADGVCSTTAIDYGNSSPSITTQTDTTNNTKFICLYAEDALGNISTLPSANRINIDITPPDTLIDTHPDDPTNSDSADFTFHATETASFACSLDSADGCGSCDGSMTYTDLSDGEHTFYVKAIDTATNEDPTPATYAWSIDTTAPNTTIDSGPDDPTNSTSATFTFTSNDGMATFECSLDSADDYGNCTSSITYTDLADGDHTFYVKAIDSLDNEDSTPASYAWTIDATAPGTTLDSHPDSSTTSTSATFEFSSDDENASFECQLDDEDDYSDCESPKNYTDLATGSHTFSVKATDEEDNEDQTPATFSWTINGEAPAPANNDNNDDDHDRNVDVHAVKITVVGTSITLKWKTDYKANSKLKYGLNKKIKSKKNNSQKKKTHTVTLANLLPNTLYYLKAYSTDKYDNQDSSKIYQVRTGK